MKDKLIINKQEIIPLKALPSDEARSEQVLGLGIWLDGILSLDGDKSVRRLEVLLPIIQQEAWGFSVKEIKEAFMLYVKSELMYNNELLEPRDNFLTIILFNKVIQAYRDTLRNRNPKINKDMDEEKATKDLLYVIGLFDYFTQSNKLPLDSVWVYTYLEERLSDFVFTNQEKQILMKLGSDQKLSEADAKEKAKLVLMRRYFDKLIAKSIHLKELL